MKTQLGIFPLFKRMNEAAETVVPLEMIRDLSSLYEPSQINEICFQYKIWYYLSEIENCCEACGNHLPIGSKSTSKTCSNKCHLIVKRNKSKGESTPMEDIRNESKERLQNILMVWDKASEQPYKTVYQWHKVIDGWKVASKLE